MTTSNKIWYGILISTVSFLLFMAFYLVVSPKRTIRYELAGYTPQGIPCINVDIENSPDNTIRLSKEVSWEQAVRMVDSLNAILHKYPISK